MPTLRRLHSVCGLLVGLFVAVHLANHLALLWGTGSHLAVMAELRLIYRNPIIEPVLLGAVLLQVVTGMFQVGPRLRIAISRRDWQAMSGAYLAFFLFVHVSAILMGRIALGLDTNLYFGAAGFHAWPFPLFFVPYYGLAVVAFCVHAALAVQKKTGVRLQIPSALFGAATGLLIIGLMLGLLHSITVPDAYLALYR